MKQERILILRGQLTGAVPSQQGGTGLTNLLGGPANGRALNQRPRFKGQVEALYLSATDGVGGASVTAYLTHVSGSRRNVVQVAAVSGTFSSGEQGGAISSAFFDTAASGSDPDLTLGIIQSTTDAASTVDYRIDLRLFG